LGESPKAALVVGYCIFCFQPFLMGSSACPAYLTGVLSLSVLNYRYLATACLAHCVLYLSNLLVSCYRVPYCVPLQTVTIPLKVKPFESPGKAGGLATLLNPVRNSNNAPLSRINPAQNPGNSSPSRINPVQSPNGSLPNRTRSIRNLGNSSPGRSRSSFYRTGSSPHRTIEALRANHSSFYRTGSILHRTGLSFYRTGSAPGRIAGAFCRTHSMPNKRIRALNSGGFSSRPAGAMWFRRSRSPLAVGVNGSAVPRRPPLCRECPVPPPHCRLTTMGLRVARPWVGLVGEVPHGACMAGKHCYALFFVQFFWEKWIYH
jgi:hypothetical protein